MQHLLWLLLFIFIRMAAGCASYDGIYVRQWIATILFYCSIHHCQLAVADYSSRILHPHRRRRLHFKWKKKKNLRCAYARQTDLPLHFSVQCMKRYRHAVAFTKYRKCNPSYFSNMILITYLTTTNDTNDKKEKEKSWGWDEACERSADGRWHEVWKSAAQRISDLFRQGAFSWTSLVMLSCHPSILCRRQQFYIFLLVFFSFAAKWKMRIRNL